MKSEQPFRRRACAPPPPPLTQGRLKNGVKVFVSPFTKGECSQGRIALVARRGERNNLGAFLWAKPKKPLVFSRSLWLLCFHFAPATSKERASNGTARLRVSGKTIPQSPICRGEVLQCLLTPFLLMRQAQKKGLCPKKSAEKKFRRLRTATAVVGGSRSPFEKGETQNFG